MTLDELPLVTRRFIFGTETLAITAVDDQEALLRQTDGRPMLPFGLMLWESAVLLADALAARGRAGHDLKGLRVLDLGCGAGLPGVMAARLGAHVLAVDYDGLALELCRRNAAANGVASLVETSETDWRTWQPEPTFDLVLGADIVYDRDDQEPILRVISAAVAPDGTLLFTDPSRVDTRGFVARLEAVFAMTSATHHATDLITAGQTISIEVMTGRRRA